MPHTDRQQALPGYETPVREILHADTVTLGENESVAEALSRLHRGNIGERIVYFYVTDSDGGLRGVVPVRRLLLSDGSALVRDIMVSPVESVREWDSFGTALQKLTARRLLALPVVDADGRLKGAIDVSAFTGGWLDVERRETAEEAFQLAGIHIEQTRARRISWVLANRFPWLLSNITAGLIAAWISNQFRELLDTVVALAFFVPLLLTIAESVAVQSATIALRRVQVSRRVPARGGVLREFRVGLLLGLGAAVIVGAIGVLWLRTYRVALVVAAGLTAAGAIGAVLGYTVPRLVRRWKLNPVVASGPVALAFADVASLTAYFCIAAAFLQ